MKRLLALILTFSMLLATTACTIEEVGKTFDDAKDQIQKTASEIFYSTKSAAIQAYGTAKDKAVYVYDMATDWASDAYENASGKVSELIGDGKDFLNDLFDVDDVILTDGEDNSPYATAKSELFVPYHISSVLADRGYAVYSGGVYYQGNVYTGLIFTKNDVFIEEGGSRILSCGFLQLVSAGYTGTRITPKMAETGLVAVASMPEGEDSMSFIVEDHAQIDPFSGIIDDTYFAFKQTSPYVIEIEFKENIESNYDREIELYDFDHQRSVYAPQKKSEIKELYDEQYAVYEAAADTSNSVADYIESSNDEVSSLVVLGNDFLDTICEKTSSGFSAMSAYFKQLLSEIEINDRALVRIDAKGKTHFLESEDPADGDRMATGLIHTLGSGMTATAKAVGTAATVVFSVHNGAIVVSAIVIATGTCSIVYNVSNMLEGAQDIYYGAKGNTTEAENPILSIFKEAIPDEKVATLIYHIWGICNTVISGALNPIVHALQIAKSCGFQTFRKIGSAARASVAYLAKLAATGVASGLVSSYVKKIVKKVTGSNTLGSLVGFGSASVTSYFVYTGLDQFDKTFNLSGLYPKYTLLDENGNELYINKDGEIYRKNNTLMAGTSSKTGELTYVTDKQGRPKTVSGQLALSEEKRQPIPVSIKSIGKGDELPTDDRGHIVSHRLGGVNDLENLFPQDMHINRGEYKIFEDQLTALLKAGHKITILYTLEYQGNSHRPTGLNCVYTVDGETSVRHFGN